MDSMISSRKFWTPVGWGLLATVIGCLGLLMTLLGAGAHGRPDTTFPALGTLLFPFAVLLESDTNLSLALAAIAFLVQFPIYGVLVGRGNFAGNPKPQLLTLAIVHIVALLLANFTS